MNQPDSPISEKSAADLIRQLAEQDDVGQVSGDQPNSPTVASLKNDLDTMVSDLRKPPPVDEFEDESECRQALDLVKAIAREASAGTAAAADSDSKEVADLGTLGQYKLISKLGEGGMGAVYKALHQRLRRVVALKVLPADRLRNPDAVARFDREMEAVGQLNHPNIVAAHDAGEVDGKHYLVMELVDGVDLSALLHDRGPLPMADACELIRQAAVGLGHAHKRGMVHRDIKPSNLMLAANEDGEPLVKVLDMGLALLGEQHAQGRTGLTTSGQMMGTLEYMAPEQGMDSHDVDIRADIYSLGGSLYKLLCGKAPFSSDKYDTPVKMIMALATEKPPSIGTRTALPTDLVRVIDRMLEKKPEDRFDTPQQVVDALAPFTEKCNLAALLDDNTAHAAARQADVAATRDHITSGSVDTEVTADHSPKPEKVKIASKKEAVEPEKKKVQTDKKRVQPEKEAAVKRKLPPRPGALPKVDPSTAGASRPPTAVPNAAPRPRKTSAAPENPAARMPVIKTETPRPGSATGMPAIQTDAAKRAPAESPRETTAPGMPAIKTDTTKRVARTVARPKRNTPTWLPIAVAAGLGGVVLLAAVIMLLPGKNGTVRIEINDPSIAVTVSGDDRYRVKGKDGEFEIAAGEHNLHITAGDTTFQTKEFTVGKGEQVALRVTLLDGKKVQVVEGDAVLDEQLLPQAAIAASKPKPSGSKPTTVGKTDPTTATTSPAGNVAGYALQINGGSKNPAPSTSHSVGLPPWKIVKHQDFTIDFWIRANGGNGQKLFVAEPYYVMTDTGKVYFKYNKPGYSDVKGGHIGEWAHVAVVVEGNEMRMYYNGHATGSLKVTEREDELPRMYLGGRMWGEIDEVRISNVARYNEDFTPATRFSPDNATVALYHCDEGSGLEVKDSSGNGRHGKIPILNDKKTPLAVWIKADGPTGSVEAAADGDQHMARFAAAKAILTAGGELRIAVDGSQQAIKTPDEVPETPFKVLHVTSCKVDMLDRIMPFREELTFLSLNGSLALKDAERLAALPQLEHLKLNDVEAHGKTTNDDLAGLRGCAKLKVLHFMQLAMKELELPELPALVELKIAYGKTESITGALDELPNLRFLDVFFAPITDDGLNFATPPKRLEMLRIDHGGQTDACLTHIGRISTLTSLHIWHTKITRTGVEALQKQLPQCGIKWGKSYKDEITLPPLPKSPTPDG